MSKKPLQDRPKVPNHGIDYFFGSEPLYSRLTIRDGLYYMGPIYTEKKEAFACTSKDLRRINWRAVRHIGQCRYIDLKKGAVALVGGES